VDCPDNCPNPSQYRVSSNASMFGIRGSEPLGGGVNAIFQVESKLFLDTGGGILAGRESFLGFQSPWGTVKLGFFLSPYDDIQQIFGNAPTLTTSILSTGALWAQAYLGPALAGGFDGRLANSVRYELPTLAGFSGSVQYSSAEGAPTTNSGIVSVGGFYNNGPVQLGAAYELHHNIRGTVDAPLSDTAFSIAGGYQFEGFRIGGVYERLRYDATPSTDLTRDFYGIGVTVDAGPGLLYGYWGRAGDGKGSAANGSNVGGLVKGESTGATQWELSYTYLLSARTLLYGGYVKINNQSNASYTFDANPYPVFCNTYPNGGCGRPGGFILGAVHFF
jgi:predicted porin